MFWSQMTNFFNMGQHVRDLIVGAYSVWNKMVLYIFDLLATEPTEFSDGDLWSIIEKINPIFVGVGSSLLVLFFIIGLCSESIDIKQEFRFEQILRLLIRLGIGEWLIANNLEIMKGIFKSVSALVKLISANDMAGVDPLKLTLTPEIETMMLNLNFMQGFICLLFAIVAFLAIVVCSVFILYTIYFRFLKIVITVPFGGLAASTVSGNRIVNSSALAFYKYLYSFS